MNKHLRSEQTVWFTKLICKAFQTKIHKSKHAKQLPNVTNTPHLVFRLKNGM